MSQMIRAKKLWLLIHLSPQEAGSEYSLDSNALINIKHNQKVRTVCSIR